MITSSRLLWHGIYIVFGLGDSNCDGSIDTVRKFHNFPITQILREINFWDSYSAKSAVLTHLEAISFDFCECLHFLKANIDFT